ncbi:MAG: ABC transporter permease subunit [Phycisphaerae bacterium]|nr:ABC transporter permease subunit [Phycisphaerae bacterium]
MPWPSGLEINLALAQGDASSLARAAPGDEITIGLLRDYNLPLELSFALVPTPDSNATPLLTVKGTLKEVRAGRLLLDRPVGGRIEIPSTDLLTREALAVRAHEFRLASGEVIRADSIAASGDDEITLSRGRASARAIRRDQIVEYRPIGPLAVGREDSFFYLRIPLGGSVLAGALTLMLVILPVVIISSQEALRAVPRSLREGAFAAGATRWQVVSRMVLPSAIPGIMTGVILAMSRAIGEAAPLLVVGGFLFITFTPVNVMSDFAAMPLQIYQWASRPQPEFYSVAASGIIVLLTVLLAFNAAAILIRQKFQKHTR